MNSHIDSVPCPDDECLVRRHERVLLERHLRYAHGYDRPDALAAVEAAFDAGDGDGS